MSTGVVLHIPHASALIPAHEAKRLKLEGDALRAELLRVTDWFTDELFDLQGPAIRQLVFPVSRLVVDPERFRDDANEPMALCGRGVIYTKTSDGQTVREQVDWQERERLLTSYYDPHHQALANLVRETLSDHDRCLIIDAHSFPSRPWPCDPDQASARPDFCLGTDECHTPQRLWKTAQKVLESKRWSVALNQPYAGCIVPQAFHLVEKRVESIMIEVKRDLYMDERTGAKRPCFGEVLEQLQDCLHEIIRSMSQPHDFHAT